MRRGLLLSILTIIFVLTIDAQNNKDDFKSYREKVLFGYKGFRKSIMEDYASFLNGIWEDYCAFKGEKNYPLPKPKVQPEKKKDEPQPKPKEVVPEEVKPVTLKTPDKSNDPKPVIVNPSNMVTFDWCGMSMKLPNAKIQGNLRGTDKESILAYFEALVL